MKLYEILSKFAWKQQHCAATKSFEDCKQCSWDIKENFSKLTGPKSLNWLCKNKLKCSGDDHKQKTLPKKSFSEFVPSNTVFTNLVGFSVADFVGDTIRATSYFFHFHEIRWTKSLVSFVIMSMGKTANKFGFADFLVVYWTSRQPGCGPSYKIGFINGRRSRQWWGATSPSARRCRPRPEMIGGADWGCCLQHTDRQMWWRPLIVTVTKRYRDDVPINLTLPIRFRQFPRFSIRTRRLPVGKRRKFS